MKREKRTTNPSQCGENCELQFSEILNTVLFRDNYSLNIENVKNKLPSDVLARTSGYALFEIKCVDGRSWQKIINFYKNNGVKSSDNNRYSIDKIINAKITLTKFESRHYYITSFSAEMPPLPEKDNEQPLPMQITKHDGEYQYSQFQDKLDYLMVQQRDFDKFNYSYLYWVPIFNFFDDNFKYMNEMSLKLNGFKENSKFTLIRSFEPENSLYFLIA